ncbi:hypothetical protein ACFLSS_02760 [Bacteroidota bacterium]
MEKLRKIFGPESKYDKSLPYTYTAEVRVIDSDDDLVAHYFSDTICGLIKYLDNLNIPPNNVELFGIYMDKETLLKKDRCTNPDGEWLSRPDICRSLEEHYKKTLDERYKGHVDKGECSFEDRDRIGY